MVYSLVNWGYRLQESGKAVEAVTLLWTAILSSEKEKFENLGDWAVEALQKCHESDPQRVSVEFERVAHIPWPW